MRIKSQAQKLLMVPKPIIETKYIQPIEGQEYINI